MKVLFCASEALPFAATGGLADVAGSLPQALRARLIGCRVVMPLYESVPQELRDNMKFLTSISVPVAWRRQYCGIFEAKVGNVIYYLIETSTTLSAKDFTVTLTTRSALRSSPVPFWRCCRTLNLSLM